MIKSLTLSLILGVILIKSLPTLGICYEPREAKLMEINGVHYGCRYDNNGRARHSDDWDFRTKRVGLQAHDASVRRNDPVPLSYCNLTFEDRKLPNRPSEDRYTFNLTWTMPCKNNCTKIRWEYFEIGLHEMTQNQLSREVFQVFPKNDIDHQADTTYSFPSCGWWKHDNVYEFEVWFKDMDGPTCDLKLLCSERFWTPDVLEGAKLN